MHILVAKPERAFSEYSIQQFEEWGKDITLRKIYALSFHFLALRSLERLGPDSCWVLVRLAKLETSTVNYPYSYCMVYIHGQYCP